MSVSVIIGGINTVLALLFNKKTWKALGVAVGAICAPIILIVVAVMSMASAAAEHNRSTVIACFDSTVTLSTSAPTDFTAHVTALRNCLAAIDSAAATLDIPDDAPALDTTLVKAIYYGLHYGEDQPALSDAAALAFVECFVTYEERTRPVTPAPDTEGEDADLDDDPDSDTDQEPEMETYTVAIPITDLPTVFRNVAQHTGQGMGGETQSGCMEVYYIVKYGDASRADQNDALLDALMDGGTDYIGGAAGSPFADDWRGHVTSEFGLRRDPFTGKQTGHGGLDLAAAYGTPIRAVAAGTVILARYGHASYGNYIVIDHGGGICTLYAHCSALTATVGQTVAAGDQIAKVGSTGRSTGNHLHIEVRINGERVNPRTFLA